MMTKYGLDIKDQYLFVTTSDVQCMLLTLVIFL